MAKASEIPLQPNPFRTYRDPKTGLWVVIKASPLEASSHVSQAQKTSLKSEVTIQSGDNLINDRGR